MMMLVRGLKMVRLMAELKAQIVGSAKLGQTVKADLWGLCYGG
jgi:hypothetical protein